MPPKPVGRAFTPSPRANREGSRHRCRYNPPIRRQSMKRRIILGSLLVLGAISIAVAQQAPQPSANALMVTKLKDNLYVLKGGGGNTSVFITGNGVTVVDTKNPGWGAPVLE